MRSSGIQRNPSLVTRSQAIGKAAAALCAAALTLSRFAGCAVPPHASDPTIALRGVNRALIDAPLVTIHVLRVNHATAPFNAWQNALDRFARDVHGDIRLIDAGEWDFPADARGSLIEPFHWPLSLAHAGPPANRVDLVPNEKWYTEDAQGRRLTLTTTLADGRRRTLPFVRPNEILIAIIPSEQEKMNGWCIGVPVDDGKPGIHLSWSLIVLQADTINRHAGWFVDREKLWEQVIFHELGHALGVPANADHAWKGPAWGLHCTHPECAMYPAVDWRSLLSGLLHGWPLDFCEKCRAELKGEGSGD